MARIVLGVGASHTPMLNLPADEWPLFIERDSRRSLIDNDGAPTTYDALLRQAPASIAAEIAPGRLMARHDAAQAAIVRIGDTIRRAELDALIVVGDDQDELFHADNMPGISLYYGETIPNVPLRADFKGPDWARRAAARHYEEKEPRNYPVHARLARHLIGELIDREFDLASAASVPPGEGEGHAVGFVHKRVMTDFAVPVVPVFVNTYYPPNQPTPRRCYKLGQAIRAAVESYPGGARVGILASGGLSHFVVDEALDREVLDLLAKKDGDGLASLPREKLNSGNSEIRNWICVAGAVEDLTVDWCVYEPGYRTPAGTGCGLGFAAWR
jgi:3-O-methylgallate 3,4-dioxygenase